MITSRIVVKKESKKERKKECVMVALTKPLCYVWERRNKKVLTYSCEKSYIQRIWGSLSLSKKNYIKKIG